MSPQKKCRCMCHDKNATMSTSHMVACCCDHQYTQGCPFGCPDKGNPFTDDRVLV